MVAITDPLAYAASLQALKAATGQSYLGRLAQIFLACKFYGSTIPRIGSAVGIESGQFQKLLDDLYEKPSQGERSVVSLFSANHVGRTGSIPAGQTTATNIWRNNFNIQKGFGCYGSASELLTPSFRNTSRKNCPHLIPGEDGGLAKGRCELDPSASYRGDDHSKIFRIDPTSRDIFVYDPDDIAFYRPLIRTFDDQPLPIEDLITALYHDSRIAAGRDNITAQDFRIDFGFSEPEFEAYFTPAQETTPSLGVASPPALPFGPAEPQVPPPPPPPILPEDLPAPTSAGKPPAGSRWWDAEQVVRAVLEADGWSVIDRSRQRAGFDLQATKATRTIFVEVKSSGGLCAPTLTDNEFKQATRLAEKYILAVVENFDPAGEPLVYWVPNPAQLASYARSVVVYPISRASWRKTASETL